MQEIKKECVVMSLAKWGFPTDEDKDTPHNVSMMLNDGHSGIQVTFNDGDVTKENMKSLQKHHDTGKKITVVFKID